MTEGEMIEIREKMSGEIGDVGGIARACSRQLTPCRLSSRLLLYQFSYLPADHICRKQHQHVDDSHSCSPHPTTYRHTTATFIRKKELMDNAQLLYVELTAERWEVFPGFADHDIYRCRGGVVVRQHSPPTSMKPGGFAPGFFACGNRTGRCRWLAGFLGELPLPPHLYSGAAPYSAHFTSIGYQDLDVKLLDNIFSQCRASSEDIHNNFVLTLHSEVHQAKVDHTTANTAHNIPSDSKRKWLYRGTESLKHHMVVQHHLFIISLLPDRVTAWPTVSFRRVADEQTAYRSRVFRLPLSRTATATAGHLPVAAVLQRLSRRRPPHLQALLGGRPAARQRRHRRRLAEVSSLLTAGRLVGRVLLQDPLLRGRAAHGRLRRGPRRRDPRHAVLAHRLVQRNPLELDDAGSAPQQVAFLFHPLDRLLVRLAAAVVRRLLRRPQLHVLPGAGTLHAPAPLLLLYAPLDLRHVDKSHVVVHLVGAAHLADRLLCRHLRAGRPHLLVEAHAVLQLLRRRRTGGFCPSVVLRGLLGFILFLHDVMSTDSTTSLLRRGLFNTECSHAATRARSAARPINYTATTLRACALWVLAFPARQAGRRQRQFYVFRWRKAAYRLFTSAVSTCRCASAIRADPQSCYSHVRIVADVAERKDDPSYMFKVEYSISLACTEVLQGKLVLAQNCTHSAHAAGTTPNVVNSSRSYAPVEVKRGRNGAATECKGRGNREIPRKPAKQRYHPARFPHVKNPESTQKGIEPSSPRWPSANRIAGEEKNNSKSKLFEIKPLQQVNQVLDLKEWSEEI
ncbi:hypothetical protein PR048_001097 [Dryococelus australis]|uniref:Uncharacterized protein n=1 Tax=Dryococelus australis TaxID=614101 RepID=A0ABQ9IGD7_9NEOP|nr:hypothetical protein PR048_001097 [Dryococelus australis]